MSVSGRVAFRDELAKLAAEDSRVLCLEADLGGAKHPFEKAYPERFMNIGISELAGIDLAGGLAATGFVPFFSTFAPFAALRAAESLKLTLGYMDLNVKVVAPYAGVSGGWFGTSHHCLEDLAIVQSFPGITIAAPYGERETREVIRRAARADGPFYIRMGRNDAFASLEAEAPSTSGQLLWHRKPRAEPKAEAARIALVSVGERGTELAVRAVEQDPLLAHAHLTYLDHASLKLASAELGAEFDRLIVIEEHRPTGGVASSLALLLPRAQVLGVNCGMAWSTHGGNQADVLSELGFTAEALQKTIHELRNQ
jgi:transketolase